jgi:hypothetical protein
MPKKNSGFRLVWRKERENWEIIWYENGRRKRLSMRTANREQADQALARHIKADEHRIVSRLVRDILADYQTKRCPHIIDPKRIAYAILNLAPYFGDMTDIEVTSIPCQDYTVRRRKEGAKDGTIIRELGILHTAFKHDWQAKELNLFLLFGSQRALNKKTDG